jgi:hypothetical protein
VPFFSWQQSQYAVLLPSSVDCNCGDCGCCPGCFFSRLNNSCVGCPPGTVSSVCHDNSFCDDCPAGFYCPSDHMRSPLRCPTDAFSEAAATQCYNCSSANADALQCEMQPLFTQIGIKTIIALGATLILVNAAFTYHYVRMRKRQGTHTSPPALWLLLALSIDPLVWAIWRIWRYRQNRRRQSQITEPLLSDQSLPSLSLPIDSTASLQLQKVHSRHVKINKHVEPKRGGAGTVQQAYWNGQTYAIKNLTSSTR